MRLLKLAALGSATVALVGIAMMTDSGPPAGEIRVGYFLNSGNVDFGAVQAIVTARGAPPSIFGQASVVQATMVTVGTGHAVKEVSAFALTRAVIQHEGPTNYYEAEERFVDLRRLGVRLVHVRPLRC